MGNASFERTCEMSTQAGILLILALAVVASRSLSIYLLTIPLALLCFLLLDMLRPSIQLSTLAAVVLFVGGAAFFTLRFVLEFPLTASPAYLQARFIGSFADPLPLTWIVVSIVTTIYSVYRRFVSTDSPIHSQLVTAIVLFAAIALYHLSLGPRIDLSRGDTTLSVPWASVLLFVGIGSQCMRIVRGAQVRFGDRPLGVAYCATFGMLAAHLLALRLILSGRYDLGAGHELAILGAVLGPLLFAGLVSVQLASSQSSQRTRLSVILCLSVILVWAWTRIDMLPTLVSPILSLDI